MHTPPLILIADDEPDTAGLLKRIANRAGFDVETAADGIIAVQLATELLPDLILLDIQMPNLNGFQVMEKLRQEQLTRQIPIIVITAAATQPADVVRGIEIGADDYITKPFNYQELTARIRAKIRAKELEENLQKRTAELETLVMLGTRLSYSQEIEPLAEQLLTFLHQQFDVSASLLHLYATDDHPGLSLHHTGDGLIQDKKKRLATYYDTNPATDVLALDEQAAAYIFDDSAIQSGMLTLLIHDDGMIGALAVGHWQADFFGDTLRVMRSVSRQAALAIRNAQLYESLRLYATELENRVEERTEALKTTQAQLMRAEKLAALGRLSGEIAHEINNPLQPILGCIESALEEVENGLPVDPEGLQLAVSEVRRIQRTVKRLLDYAKPDSAGVAKLNIGEIVQGVVALTQKKVDQLQVTLVTKIEETPAIHANPDQLKQVFLNLTLNALEAMPEKGTLTLHVWHDATDVHVAVQDTGSGIAPDKLSQILEPFYSTKQEGSGLGLAISHSIIDAHGGKLDVESTPGAGSQFTVSLPLR